MSHGTCSIEGCERSHYARGWCVAHYNRWCKTGDVGLAEIRPRGRNCQVAGCTRPHNARGWCRKHYYDWQKAENPTLGPAPRGAAHPCWIGDNVTIVGAHLRIRAAYGSASGYPCLYCSRPKAGGWAYNHCDPNEKHNDVGHAYSPDPSYYIPLCWPCHTRLDRRLVAAFEAR